MRLNAGLAALLTGFLLYFAPAPAQAQVITEGADSVRVLVPDTLEGDKGFFLANFKNIKNLDRPAKAALWSAVIPGGGQFYNKAYWKIPIVYATGAVLGYFLIDNNTKYQSFRTALLLRSDKDSTTVDEYANNPEFPSLNETFGGDALRNIKFRRDYYRRNRDLTVLLSIGAYALQMAEAYVHAHLKEFDVSDDLALRVQPNLIPVTAATTTMAPALTITLYTRPK
ncbi:hypothetical protein GCM10023188_11930 [Pontibacter saemangeumensis]|uniref:DUF5683 domain-containing protein n=1 Tax=Pontibacter saemangeumensis TaxID=1084525 RepID=A0ABP8LFL9_9BACT